MMEDSVWQPLEMTSGIQSTDESSDCQQIGQLPPHRAQSEREAKQAFRVRDAFPFANLPVLLAVVLIALSCNTNIYRRISLCML